MEASGGQQRAGCASPPWLPFTQVRRGKKWARPRTRKACVANATGSTRLGGGLRACYGRELALVALCDSPNLHARRAGLTAGPARRGAETKRWCAPAQSSAPTRPRLPTGCTACSDHRLPHVAREGARTRPAPRAGATRPTPPPMRPPSPP